jgi:E3 ubiquitin-protein ligase RNF19A
MIENSAASVATSKLDTIETINELKPPITTTSKKYQLPSETFSLVSSSGVGSSIHTQTNTDMLSDCHIKSYTNNNNNNSCKLNNYNGARVIFDTTSNNLNQNNCDSNKTRSNSIMSKNALSVSNNSQQKRNRSSNMQLNNRIRSAFEIFRNTFNTSTSSTNKNSLHNNNNNKNNNVSSSNKSSISKKSNKENTKSSNIIEISSSSKIINLNPTSNNDNNSSISNIAICQLCFNECPRYALPGSFTNYMYNIDTCEHSFCFECLRQYLKYQIIESRVSISCPQCNEKMHPSDIYNLLSSTNLNVNNNNNNLELSNNSGSSSPNNSNKSLLNTNNSNNNNEDNKQKEENWSQLIQKYEEFMLRRVLVTIPDTRWCPAPDCTYAVIASGCANCPQLFCMRPNCNTSFCYHCKQYWHPNLTCEDAAIRNNQSTIGTFLTQNSDLFQEMTGGGASNSGSSANKLIRSLLQRSNSHISTSSSNNLNLVTAANGLTNTTTILTSRSTTGDLIKEEIKRCPKCQALIVKMDDGSCNHITCSVCGCEFCWLCMKEISDLHYLSPSGCTFWGKKPWSRKKKILWQLGTLIGAPVGIALIAGVAVPSILIGLPIWSGRKVYLRYKTIGRHKRNLIVVGTVFGAIIVAPLVAALAVGIGVPILLAYVYGVVPISLCRSGGCGVTTNNNGGVRFAFDDENTDSNYVNINSLTGVGGNATSQQQTNGAFSKKSELFKSKKSENNLTVTIPISAAGINDLIRSDSNNNNNDSKDLNNTDIQVPNNSVNISNNNNNAQTPVLVTITMATKSSNNYSSDLNGFNNNSNKNSIKKHRHHHHHSKSKKSSSKSKSNNKKTNNSISVACGTVELKSKDNIKISSTNGINVSPAGDAEILAGTAMSTMKRLNILIDNKNPILETKKLENENEKKLIDNINNNDTKSCSNSKKVSNNNSRKVSNINNPSIGDISIGAYTTSFSASLSGSNLYQDDEDVNSNNEEEESQDDNNDDDEQSNINTNSDSASNSKMLNDHDSASNIALAGGSIKLTTNGGVIGDDDNQSRQTQNEKLDVKSTTSNNLYEKQISFTSHNMNMNGNINVYDNKNDTYSISMISQKSANPSVIALAGSVKLAEIFYYILNS